MPRFPPAPPQDERDDVHEAVEALRADLSDALKTLRAAHDEALDGAQASRDRLHAQLKTVTDLLAETAETLQARDPQGQLDALDQKLADLQREVHFASHAVPRLADQLSTGLSAGREADLALRADAARLFDQAQALERGLEAGLHALDLRLERREEALQRALADAEERDARHAQETRQLKGALEREAGLTRGAFAELAGEVRRLATTRPPAVHVDTAPFTVALESLAERVAGAEARIVERVAAAQDGLSEAAASQRTRAEKRADDLLAALAQAREESRTSLGAIARDLRAITERPLASEQTLAEGLATLTSRLHAEDCRLEARLRALGDALQGSEAAAEARAARFETMALEHRRDTIDTTRESASVLAAALSSSTDRLSGVVEESQRHVRTTLEALRAELRSLEEVVVAAPPPVVHVDAKPFADTVASLHARLRDMDEQLSRGFEELYASDAREGRASRDAAKAALEETSAAVEASTAGLREELRSLGDAIRRQHEEPPLTQVEARSLHEALAEKFERGAASLDSRLRALDSRIAGLASAVDAAPTSVHEGLTQETARLQRELQEVQRALTSHLESASASATQATAAARDATRRDMEALAGRLDALDAHLGSIEGELLAARQPRVAEAVEQVCRDVHALHARLDSFSQALPRDLQELRVALMPPPAVSPADLAGTEQALAQRVQETEARLAQRLRALHESLAPVLAEAAAPAASFAVREEAARLAQHLARLESTAAAHGQTTASDLESLRKDLSSLSKAIDALPDAQRLQLELTELRERIGSSLSAITEPLRVSLDRQEAALGATAAGVRAGFEQEQREHRKRDERFSALVRDSADRTFEHLLAHDSQMRRHLEGVAAALHRLEERVAALASLPPAEPGAALQPLLARLLHEGHRARDQLLEALRHAQEGADATAQAADARAHEHAAAVLGAIRHEASDLRTRLGALDDALAAAFRQERDGERASEARHQALLEAMDVARRAFDAAGARAANRLDALDHVIVDSVTALQATQAEAAERGAALLRAELAGTRGALEAQADARSDQILRALAHVDTRIEAAAEALRSTIASTAARDAEETATKLAAVQASQGDSERLLARIAAVLEVAKAEARAHHEGIPLKLQDLEGKLADSAAAAEASLREVSDSVAAQIAASADRLTQRLEAAEGAQAARLQGAIDLSPIVAAEAAFAVAGAVREETVASRRALLARLELQADEERERAARVETTLDALPGAIDRLAQAAPTAIRDGLDAIATSFDARLMAAEARLAENAEQTRQAQAEARDVLVHALRELGDDHLARDKDLATLLVQGVDRLDRRLAVVPRNILEPLGGWLERADLTADARASRLADSIAAADAASALRHEALAEDLRSGVHLVRDDLETYRAQAERTLMAVGGIMTAALGEANAWTANQLKVVEQLVRDGRTELHHAVDEGALRLEAGAEARHDRLLHALRHGFIAADQQEAARLSKVQHDVLSDIREVDERLAARLETVEQAVNDSGGRLEQLLKDGTAEAMAHVEDLHERTLDAISLRLEGVEARADARAGRLESAMAVHGSNVRTGLDVVTKHVVASAESLRGDVHALVSEVAEFAAEAEAKAEEGRLAMRDALDRRWLVEDERARRVAHALDAVPDLLDGVAASTSSTVRAEAEALATALGGQVEQVHEEVVLRAERAEAAMAAAREALAEAIRLAEDDHRDRDARLSISLQQVAERLDTRVASLADQVVAPLREQVDARVEHLVSTLHQHADDSAARDIAMEARFTERADSVLAELQLRSSQHEALVAQARERLMEAIRAADGGSATREAALLDELRLVQQRLEAVPANILPPLQALMEGAERAAEVRAAQLERVVLHRLEDADARDLAAAAALERQLADAHQALLLRSSSLEKTLADTHTLLAHTAQASAAAADARHDALQMAVMRAADRVEAHVEALPQAVVAPLSTLAHDAARDMRERFVHVEAMVLEQGAAAAARAKAFMEAMERLDARQDHVRADLATLLPLRQAVLAQGGRADERMDLLGARLEAQAKAAQERDARLARETAELQGSLTLLSDRLPDRDAVQALHEAGEQRFRDLLETHERNDAARGAGLLDAVGRLGEPIARLDRVAADQTRRLSELSASLTTARQQVEARVAQESADLGERVDAAAKEMVQRLEAAQQPVARSLDRVAESVARLECHAQMAEATRAKDAERVEERLEALAQKGAAAIAEQLAEVTASLVRIEARQDRSVQAFALRLEQVEARLSSTTEQLAQAFRRAHEAAGHEATARDEAIARVLQRLEEQVSALPARMEARAEERAAAQHAALASLLSEHADAAGAHALAMEAWAAPALAAIPQALASLEERLVTLETELAKSRSRRAITRPPRSAASSPAAPRIATDNAPGSAEAARAPEPRAEAAPAAVAAAPAPRRGLTFGGRTLKG